MINRFSFPGVTLVAKKNTPTHEVEVVEVSEGGYAFTCELIRRRGLDFEANFLLASVKDAMGKNLLWSFKDQNFSGVGLLASTADGAVIALVGKGKSGKVERILPLINLVERIVPDLARTVRMKISAAEYLRREVQLSDTEQKMLSVISERRKAAEAEAAEKARIERERARNERVAKILARDSVEVTGSDGRKRHGVPVIDTEWPSLPNNTAVVLYSSIDEDGTLGTAIEAFFVEKRAGQNPRKKFPVFMSHGVPMTTPVVERMPKPLRTALVERDGQFFEVGLYPTSGIIKAARAAGLNGGALVAVAPQDSQTKKVEVQQIFVDRVDTLGYHTLVG